MFVDIEKGTVTMDGGTEIPVPDSLLSDPTNLMSAGGMSPGAFSDYMSKMDAIKSKFGKKRIKSAGSSGPRVIPMGTSSSGGGYGSKASSYSFKRGPSALDQYLNQLKNKNKTKKGVPAAYVSRKLASGESIGVKEDNLFEMIHRRYLKKRKRNEFIETVRKK